MVLDFSRKTEYMNIKSTKKGQIRPMREEYTTFGRFMDQDTEDGYGSTLIGTAELLKGCAWSSSLDKDK